MHGFAEEPVLPCLIKRYLEPFNGKGVLGPDIDVTSGGADGICPDDHTLDYRMRVALDNRSIHKRARIALVGITDYVPLISRGSRAEFPLEAGRESGAASSPKTGLLYELNHLIG